MAWDLQLFYLLNNLAGRSALGDIAIVAIATYLPFAVVGIFLLYLLLQRTLSLREKLIALGAVLLGALIARLDIGSPIRYFIPRPRPFLSQTVHQLIYVQSPSFPSGHALFFFAFSTAVYFVNKKLGVLFYILSMFICLARVAAGVHYPSDILAGAVLGTLIGWAVMRFAYPALKQRLGASGR